MGIMPQFIIAIKFNGKLIGKFILFADDVVVIMILVIYK